MPAPSAIARPASRPPLRRRALAALLALLLLLPALTLAPPAARAAGCTVTNGNDSGTGSLRAAILNAACDPITVAANVATITLSSTLTIGRSVAIQRTGGGTLLFSGGGSVRVLAITAGTVAISGVTVTGGRADDGNYGGGIRVTGGSLTLTDSLVTGNATGGALGGGGLYVGGGVLALVHTNVSSNGAAGPGGGLYIDDTYATARVTIERSTIGDNHLTYSADGGGIAIVDAADAKTVTVTMTDSTVSGNGGAGTLYGVCGGGIALRGGTLTMTGGAISDNRATYASSGCIGGDGGGLHVGTQGGTVTLIGTTVSGNRADTGSGFGGGIAVRGGVVNLTDVLLGTNQAATGGGIFVAAGALTVTRGTIAGNTAPGSGGALLIYGGTTTATGTTFSGNRAQGGGDAIVQSGTLTLANSTVSGNFAKGDGGGFLVAGGTLNLAYTTVTGNVADDDNDGTGDGGGIARTGPGTVNVRSSIVAGNADRGAQKPDCSGRIASQGYNLWGDSAACPDDGPGDRNLVALGLPIAAVLATTLADNGGPTTTHALLPASPARDTGDNVNCPPTDQRGVLRNDGKCDIGAVEYTPPAPSPSPSPSSSPSPSASPTPSPSAGPVPSFADVPVGYWAHDQIGTFARRGITTGCDVGLYCPERPVTRAEMAVFLDRTLGFPAPATPAAPRFTDVPPAYWAYAFIDTFATLGITTGCGGTEFCPDRGVTRAEMAAFLIRALKQPQLTPVTPTFADVPPSHPQFGYIEALVKLNVTTGCGTDDAGQRLYCPDRGVTRAEMAVFIIRAFP